MYGQRRSVVGGGAERGPSEMQPHGVARQFQPAPSRHRVRVFFHCPVVILKNTSPQGTRRIVAERSTNQTDASITQRRHKPRVRWVSKPVPRPRRSPRGSPALAWGRRGRRRCRGRSPGVAPLRREHGVGRCRSTCTCESEGHSFRNVYVPALVTRI